jgi:CO/xanthine dehydrogenase FAD-binding subunit
MKQTLHSGGGVYQRPRDLQQALEWLSARTATVLAGGTDLYPARAERPLPGAVLDLSAMADLRAIARDADGWRIGALATWADLARADLPPLFDALRQAAREVGGAQVQNRGTVVGNVCNASPAADGVPVLLAMDATVELASVAGRRSVPLSAFVTGPRRTGRRPDELVVALHVRDGMATRCSRFLKLGARRYLVISIAMVAAVLDLDARDRAVAVALAVGSCGPVARRLPALESRLRGAPRCELPALARAALADPSTGCLAPLAPIDDVRGTAAYRLEAAGVLLVRALEDLAR